MARLAPSTTYESPGVLVTSGLWNAGPKALNDFLTNRPTFQGILLGAPSVANNSWTAVPFDQNNIDTDGGHNVAVNNTRYTVQVDGWYWVSGMVAWNTGIPAGTFRIESAVAKTGSIWVGSSQFLAITTQGPSAISCSALVQCSFGDYLEIWGRQQTGATQNFDNGSQTDGTTRTCFCVMNVWWVSSL